jgi:hypothetical protein
MHETLPYRYQPRDPEKVFYFCHLCHKKLHAGEAFTLLAVVAKGVAVEHWPRCPRQPKPAESSNIATA